MLLWFAATLPDLSVTGAPVTGVSVTAAKTVWLVSCCYQEQPYGSRAASLLAH